MTRKSPDCPLCGYPPAFEFGEVSFCGNEECTAISWDATQTPGHQRDHVTLIEFPQGKINE